MPATHPFHSRILLAFDFDWTLAEDSFERLVAVMGFDVEDWKANHYHPLGDAGWDDILAKFEGLRRLCEPRGRTITRDAVEEAGRTTKGFAAAETMPERLRAVARAVDPTVTLEFAIVSSGYLDVFGAHPVAGVFDRRYGSAFDFDDEGVVRGVKKMISHPEKVRYLEALAKGIDVGGSNAPSRTEAELPEDELRVAFDQMIYVGDGASDLQAFGFVRDNSGFAIAVARDGGFSAEGEMLSAQRPDALAPAGYEDGSPLFEILAHAVRSHAARIALRRLGQDR
ncbi:hypothetical protein [Jiella sonneratiae]|uniref:Haloacid dehalogenase-like hydrolase n=1 Tax=Jiella sonneratiae TaxID=2816856 RepID=A0ABS3J5B8_9HYPH|nr:hypothetical protein [Jiella sonneratiae]MBO0904869.1 hypothetical protein [Jiella sonneratiae]